MFRKPKNWKNPFEEGGSLYDERDNYSVGERRLIIRISKYGTRGIIKVGSAEGAPVSIEAARNLIPAGMHHLRYLAPEIIEPQSDAE